MKKSLMIISGLFWVSTVVAVDISYQYDALNRLILVDYGNGQQVVQYSYDDAGNMLAKNVVVDEQFPPQLLISSPSEGTVFTSSSVSISGTVTDADRGNSGITSVSIFDQLADNATVAGNGVANWSIDLNLHYGDNLLTIIATDGSSYANKTTKTLQVRYQPPYIDSDSDQIDDNWEQYYFKNLNTVNQLSDYDADGQLDEIEYQQGTDPTDYNSRSINRQVKFTAGFKPFYYPLDKTVITSAFLLLEEMKSLGISVKEIQGFNHDTGLFQNAHLDLVNGLISGEDFALSEGEGVFAQITAESTILFSAGVSCKPLNLQAGINIAGFNCIPQNYTAYRLMTDILEGAEVKSIQRFNLLTGRFEAIVYQEGTISGQDFPIDIGDAYIINMTQNYSLVP